MNIVEHFPDGSTIETDRETGNLTVCGVMAHKEYFNRLRETKIMQDSTDVAVVAFCANPDGTRKAELIRRRNTNPITAQTFGLWGWEVWTDAEPDAVTRYADEDKARQAFKTAMLYGTNGIEIETA